VYYSRFIVRARAPVFVVFAERRDRFTWDAGARSKRRQPTMFIPVQMAAAAGYRDFRRRSSRARPFRRPFNRSAFSVEFFVRFSRRPIPGVARARVCFSLLFCVFGQYDKRRASPSGRWRPSPRIVNKNGVSIKPASTMPVSALFPFHDRTLCFIRFHDYGGGRH